MGPAGRPKSLEVVSNQSSGIIFVSLGNAAALPLSDGPQHFRLQSLIAVGRATPLAKIPLCPREQEPTL